MANQQEPLSAFAHPRRAKMLGDKISSAPIEALHRHPLHLEAKSLNLWRYHILHRYNPGKIHRPAVDVHDLFK
jgi:hypothetical protein